MTVATWESDLEGLRQRFDVIESTFTCAGRDFTLAHPRNSDVLIKEEDYVKDERLPYWADVWPSSRVLADHVVRHKGNGRRALELGCGSGLVACALSAAGYKVTATDYYPDALEFTHNNVWRNTGRRIATRMVDWRDMPRDLGRFSVVVASDVLYEHTHGELVSEALLATLDDDGYALIADPGRLSLASFLLNAEEGGMALTEQWDNTFGEGEASQVVTLFALNIR
ncbi:MAG: methyltransferase domain-containing protein [Gemmatimonadota bacterium]